MGGLTKAYRRRTSFDSALVAAALAGYIAVVYLAGVVALGTLLGFGPHNGALSIAATTAVAITFQKVHERTRRLVDRMLHGERATPLEVLARFSRGVGETSASEEVLARMARVIAEGTGAARAGVWLAVGEELMLASSHPGVESNAPLTWPAGPEPDIMAPVRYQGELLGALSVIKPPGEPVTSEEQRLLADVASQAGLVLRNVRLTAELAARVDEISRRSAELRASRQRVVAAQDAERRRLERDIHDGAQQHLVALAVKLRLARTIGEKDPQKAAALIAELRDVTGEALETLRDLTRGIYPPVLADEGIAAALRAGAKRLPGVVVDAEGLRRYPLAVESAVYFSCLEALQNAAKHAGASRVAVQLRETQFGISFSVTDDGGGFDVGTTPRGSGLQNVADRLAAIGGEVRIQSAPGSGTTIAGEVPAASVETS